MRAAIALEAAFSMRYQKAISRRRGPAGGGEGELQMSIDTSDGHEAMDYREHIRTYNGFLKGTVGLTVFVCVLLLGMLIFLV